MISYSSFLQANAELSGGTSLPACGAGHAGEVTTASAICWRRANQHVRHLFLDVAIATDINYQRANKELKSGSFAPHCRRGQRGGNNYYAASNHRYSARPSQGTIPKATSEL